MADAQPYEIYAIKYGDHPRLASANFIGGVPQDAHRQAEEIDEQQEADRGTD